jgi:hypothetical protein
VDAAPARQRDHPQRLPLELVGDVDDPDLQAVDAARHVDDADLQPAQLLRDIDAPELQAVDAADVHAADLHALERLAGHVDHHRRLHALQVAVDLGGAGGDLRAAHVGLRPADEPRDLHPAHLGVGEREHAAELQPAAPPGDHRRQRQLHAAQIVPHPADGPELQAIDEADAAEDDRQVEVGPEIGLGGVGRQGPGEADVDREPRGSHRSALRLGSRRRLAFRVRPVLGLRWRGFHRRLLRRPRFHLRLPDLGRLRLRLRPRLHAAVGLAGARGPDDQRQRGGSYRRDTGPGRRRGSHDIPGYVPAPDERPDDGVGIALLSPRAAAPTFALQPPPPGVAGSRRGHPVPGTKRRAAGKERPSWPGPSSSSPVCSRSSGP